MTVLGFGYWQILSFIHLVLNWSRQSPVLPIPHCAGAICSHCRPSGVGYPIGQIDQPKESMTFSCCYGAVSLAWYGGGGGALCHTKLIRPGQNCRSTKTTTAAAARWTEKKRKDRADTLSLVDFPAADEGAVELSAAMMAAAVEGFPLSAGRLPGEVGSTFTPEHRGF